MSIARPVSAGTPAAPCPLCHAEGARPYAEAHARSYLECDACRMVYLLPSHRLGTEAEKAHYDTHENDPSDPRYRAFLSRLAEPLADRLEPGAEGLDYGSGPAPTLSRMLEERGARVAVYDPYFAPDSDTLLRCYDFIACSETVEHFFDPRGQFDRIDRLLLPGGWLGVMTEMLPADAEAFGKWRYARDPTHVCFYRPATMEWIANRYRWTLELPHRNVALFRKPGRRAATRAAPIGHFADP